MSILRIFKIIFLLFLINNVAFGESINEKYQALFLDAITSNNSDYNYNKIINKAKGGNSLRFIEIGYFVNSVNEYYKKTSDLKIFAYNNQIINSLILSSKTLAVGNQWKVTSANKKETNYEMLNKEFMLYEGYLFRYLAQYIYILHNENKLETRYLNFLESNFDKWYDRSIDKHGDVSELLGLRLHMGSHWATVALYLYKITGKSKYKKFYDTFNVQLKKSLVSIKVNSKTCYIWNSTYSTRFNALLSQSKRVYTKETQDVSHGNHIVQFILDSYNCNIGGWTKTDLIYLSNTLVNIIWKNKDRPSDNVDGSSTNVKII